MLTVQKVILKEPEYIREKVKIEGYCYTGKGLKAQLFMKGYSIVNCEENDLISSIIDNDEIKEELSYTPTVMGFMSEEMGFISLKEFMSFKGKQVRSNIPNFGNVISFIRKETDSLLVNGVYVDFMYNHDYSELIKEKTKSDKYIKVEVNNEIKNINIPINILIPKRTINSKYITSEQYAILLLEEIKKDISEDLVKESVIVDKEDLEKYSTSSIVLASIYKLISDKEV